MSSVELWEYDYVNEIWVPKPAVVVPKRMTGTGQVIAGAHRLYWIACDPGAGNSLWEVTDAIAAGAAVLLSCFSTSRESKGFVFNPPCPFATGIYLETFTNMTAMTFGYV